MIVGEAHGCADGEEPSHVIDKSAARLDEQETDGVGRASGLSTRNAHDARSEQVANAHEDASDGKRRDGKHQRFAELLEILHHSVSLQPFLSLCALRRTPLRLVLPDAPPRVQVVMSQLLTHVTSGRQITYMTRISYQRPSRFRVLRDG